MGMIFVGLWALGFGASLWGTWLSVRYFSRSRKCALTGPSISILKPLKGLEPDLEENLRSFFSLNYPRFELIFCVAHSDDPCLPLVNNLISEFYAVDARIMTGEDAYGVNPKVQNLQKAYDAAVFDVVLISDSNVRVDSDYLSKLVPLLDQDKVGLVTAVVTSDFGGNLVQELEATTLSTFYARGMLMASASGFPMVMGKSMLFRRSTFSRFGGIRPLANYLAEDYMAGYAVQQLGLKVAMSPEPLTQTVAHVTFSDFWKRHLRWGRMRRVTNPIAFAFEPLVNALPSSLIGALGFYFQGSYSPTSVLTLLLGGFLIQDLVLVVRLHRRLPWNFIFLWLIRETAAPLLWVHTLWGRSVNWKGQRLKLEAGGLVTK